MANELRFVGSKEGIPPDGHFQDYCIDTLSDL